MGFLCEKCGKEFPSKRSLGGHLWLMHRIKSSPISQLKATIEEYKVKIANLQATINSLEKQLQESKTSMRKNTEALEKELKILTQELQETQQKLYCPICKKKWSEHKLEKSFWDGIPYWVCPK